jgi:hypothetical protein
MVLGVLGYVGWRLSLEGLMFVALHKFILFLWEIFSIKIG